MQKRIVNKDEIKKQTCLVVEKDGEYLAGLGSAIGFTYWDRHLTNAWKTRDKEEAMAVAAKYGGRLMLFNPIVWQTRPYNMEEKA